MTQRNNILQELSELQSSLVNAGSENVYRVPAGYFDNLAEQVLSRIKAFNTENATEELNYLSPLLSGISKQMPYTVPAGFFDGLAEGVIASVKDGHKTAAEELKELSPFLSGLKKEMPYSVPAGSFEQLDSVTNTKEIKPAAKVVYITRQKWFRYAAAAVVVGIIAVGGLLIFNKPTSVNGDDGKIVTNLMKKVSTEEIDKFVQLADEEVPDVAMVDSRNQVKDKNEIQELIKDVSDKDIQDFLNEAQLDDSDNNNNDLTN